MQIFDQDFSMIEVSIYIFILIICIFVMYKSFGIVRDIFSNIFRGIKSLVVWIKPSFEGEKGSASSRRLTAFTVMGMYMYSRIIFTSKITDPYWLLLGSITDAIFVLVLFGIVTVQQVLALKDEIKYIQKKDAIVSGLNDMASTDGASNLDTNEIK